MTAMTDLIEQGALALMRRDYPGHGFQGAELSFEDWQAMVVTDSVREGYRAKARAVIEGVPEFRLALTVSEALAALPPGQEDDAVDYTAARELLATLDEATLLRLMVLFNEAKDLALKGYREGARRRAITLNEAYAKEAQVNRS